VPTPALLQICILRAHPSCGTLSFEPLTQTDLENHLPEKAAPTENSTVIGI